MTARADFTNLSDFLKATPFDSEYDLNQTLTPEIFYDELYVDHNDRAKELMTDLRGMIDSVLEPNRVIFIKGFPGNGKTTFLHTFMRTYPDRHAYFDLQRRNNSCDDDLETDEIKLFLNRRLLEEKEIGATLRFLHSNRDAFQKAGFISFRLYEHLSDLGEEPSDMAMERSTNLFDLKDTFACLFIHLFRMATPGQKTIIYFDNFDVARMEYVTDRFLVHFQDALSTGLHISRHELFAEKRIPFRSDFRFIFCLRETNDAILNAHLSDRIGFVRAPFMISFDADMYKEVAEKRIAYAENHYRENELFPNAHATLFVLQVVLQDMYYRDVFLPLYNYDYREIASLLASVIPKYQVSTIEGKLDYRMRGVLMFAVVHRLLTNDFLRRYLNVAGDFGDAGYCYIDRVMLTTLINRSSYRRGRPQEDSSEPQDLLHMVKDLNLIYQDVPAILESIATCFLAHQEDRVHLITVLNRRIDDVAHFVPTYTELIERALSPDDSIESAKIRNELKSILIRVNPAGFTFVRYILPHFEFYSNVVENTSSLFDEPLRVEMIDDEPTYACVVKIDKVYKQVRKHVRAMKKFFERRYVTEGITRAKFARSVYCFRHPGTVKLAKPTGHSHTIKIVTAHIDYIDELRFLVLKDIQPVETMQKLNKALVDRIRKYVDLLDESIDTDIAKSFKEQFMRPIQTIIDSGYTDRTTRIERESGRARDES